MNYKKEKSHKKITKRKKAYQKNVSKGKKEKIISTI